MRTDRAVVAEDAPARERSVVHTRKALGVGSAWPPLAFRQRLAPRPTPPKVRRASKSSSDAVGRAGCQLCSKAQPGPVRSLALVILRSRRRRCGTRARSPKAALIAAVFNQTGQQYTPVHPANAEQRASTVALVWQETACLPASQLRSRLDVCTQAACMQQNVKEPSVLVPS